MKEEYIKWTKGQELDVPFTQARLKVLQYLQSARPAYSKKVPPLLEITRDDGTKTTLTAQIGQELLLKKPKVRLKIVQIFTTLKVMSSGKGHVVNAPGPARNRALVIRIERKRGKKITHQYVNAQWLVHGPEDNDFKFRYIRHETLSAAVWHSSKSLPGH